MKIHSYKYDPEQIKQNAPLDEPARQYYFIDHVRSIFKAQFEAKTASGEALRQYGPKLYHEMIDKALYGTFSVRTFGCPTV